jgi:hypothetical protein
VAGSVVVGGWGIGWGLVGPWTHGGLLLLPVCHGHSRDWSCITLVTTVVRFHLSRKPTMKPNTELLDHRM